MPMYGCMENYKCDAIWGKKRGFVAALTEFDPASLDTETTLYEICQKGENMVI